MNKVAIVGLKGSVQFFSMAGMEVFEVENENEVKNMLQRLLEEQFALIFITKSLYEQASTLINDIVTKSTVILQIPV